MSELIKNAAVIICIALCAAGGIWAWWMENGPQKKDDIKKSEQEDGEKG